MSEHTLDRGGLRESGQNSDVYVARASSGSSSNKFPEWLQARGVLAFAFGFKDAAIVSEPEGQALVSVEVVRLGLIHSFTGARGLPGSFVLVLD